MPSKVTQSRRDYESYFYNHEDGNPDQSGLASSGSISWSQGAVYGENDPSWRQSIKRHANATTSLTAYGQKVLLTPGSMSVTRRYIGPTNDQVGDPQLGQHYQNYGQLIAPFPPGNITGLSQDLVYNQALERFIQRAIQVQTQFQSGVFLGQLGKTLEQLHHPMRALHDGILGYLGALKKVRHRIPKRAKRKVLSETWLEWAYGWKPLINDISGAILAVTQKPKINVDHISSQAEDSAIMDSGSGSCSCGAYTVYFKYQLKETYSVRFRGAVLVSPDDAPDLITGNESWRSMGATLDNFLPTVWQLIPYSFLVDYFTNVGAIINAVSYPTSKIAWAQFTSRDESSWKTVDFAPDTSLMGPAGYTFLEGWGSPGTAETTYWELSRTPYFGNYIPSFRFEVPGISSLKWLNMAALARTHASLIPF